ncbi:hypothetical protein ACFPRL_29035 [Pseudoclavibacter helvolus]
MATSRRPSSSVPSNAAATCWYLPTPRRASMSGRAVPSSRSFTASPRPAPRLSSSAPT